MEIAKGLGEWFVKCFMTIPENLVVGMYMGIIFLMVRKGFNKLLKSNKKFKGGFEKVVKTWKAQPEIDATYQIVSSPIYKFDGTINNNYGSNDGVLIFVLVVIGVVGATWLRENYEKVQLVFYYSSAVFMSLSIFFVIISAIKNKIQSSTLKFSIFATAISMYIIYSANVLPQLMAKIPANLSISGMILEPQAHWPSIYVFLGIIVVIFEILIITVMLIRAFAIKIDSWMKLRFIQYVIAWTSGLDKVGGLIFCFIMLTVGSYLLTSDILVQLLFKS